MARKARYTITGVPQHLIRRGNNRAACLYAEDDYRFYLDCLGVDLNGNTWIKGNGSYGYTTTNRLKQIIASNNLIAGYDHNGLGQRVTKTLHNQTITGHPDQSDINATVQAILGVGPGTSDSDCNADSQINVQDLACLNNAITANTQGTTTTTNYTYGLNGELLAESGATTKEYIHLNGTPLAVIDNATIYYVHTDHLATPHKLTNSTGTVVWSTSYDPFGSATVNEDPDSDGTSVTFNLRFPGQYADGETGLHYNYFRTYDSSIGRYLTSDPIGLNGGLNPYNYVGGNPLSFVDPLGLVEMNPAQNPLFPGQVGGGGFGGGGGIGMGGGGIRVAPPSTAPVGRIGSPINVPSPYNSPGSVYGRDYSGHAFDRLQGRGIPPSAVENAIRRGARSPGNQPGTSQHYDQVNNLTVMIDDASGRVITVRNGPPSRVCP